MGFRYRKSIRVGKFFRINVSKSGIGYSFGVPGARITHSPNGRVTTTVGIPGTGLSYSESYNPNKRPSPKGNQSNPTYNNNGIDPAVEVESASIENFQTADVQDLIKAIKNARTVNRIGTICIIIGIILMLAVKSGVQYPIIGVVALALGIFCKYLVKNDLAVNLDYELDDEARYQHENRILAWQTFFTSQKVWQITSEANVNNRKINAGAKTAIKREIIKYSCSKLPKYIKLNVEPFFLELKKEKLLILPDKVIIFRGKSIGAIAYDAINMETAQGKFIEDEPLASDAQVVSFTWQYVNKNGGPDKRYANNRELPVCLYGYVTMRSASGLNVDLSCSNANNVIDFGC